jgi:indole-3-glycerol phosphate synthase/phosphoribosylanthranilate isomerase
MAENDIDLACRKLIYGNNKVCGLTKGEYAQSAVNAGAQFGGLIFAEKSPRFITAEQAQAITEQVPSLKYVGVFVNHPIEEVAKLAIDLSLFAVQLHGNETAEYIDLLKGNLPNTCQIWKAVPVENVVPDLINNAQLYILDGKNAGSGETFNWRALAQSEQDLTQCFLAGGLSIDNIEQAINQKTALDLFGLDLNSGVETSPGVKSYKKLQQVFAAIRHY